MKFTPTLLSGLVLVGLTVLVGVVHGQWINRWGPRPDVASAGQKLEELPLVIGDWETKRDDDLSPAVQRLLQCYGSVNRIYQNGKTGDVVAVAVLLGPPGAIAVHTPEVCYSSRDYKITQSRKRLALDDSEGAGSADELWDLRLEGNDLNNIPIRVLSGWTKNKHWNATENPRYSYGGGSYLYKIQLSGPVPVEGQERDVCRDFLQAFLPVVRKYMIDS